MIHQRRPTGNGSAPNKALLKFFNSLDIFALFVRFFFVSVDCDCNVDSDADSGVIVAYENFCASSAKNVTVPAPAQKTSAKL